MSSFRRVVLALLLLAVTVSCGSEPTETGGERPGDDRGSVEATTPAPLGQDFESDVSLAKGLAEQYWKQTFAAAGLSYRPISAFIPYTGQNGPACGGQPAVPDNAFYCPFGHFVAYDENWMRDLYDRMGDGSVYVIIPHELGHAVQAQLNNAGGLSIQRELQADCYAGGTLGALVRGNALQAEPGDKDELLLNLAAAGDPTDDWLRPDAHGTAQQRQQVFARGYNEGTSSCETR
ncbi:neutral zinc metallopeptidase [Streptosporangium sandarakinum]|uniref:Metalloprotease n=1 Tax=Streptosporangium sandarakinum TaxID=1260955 RepID=A0A852V1H5_9ACTN|nr:neutral zinc metallopeptidase [Streptosporangium sandarakinum]NYF40011.1 hypothetical protein [Streptosporangium sandarakinum]